MYCALPYCVLFYCFLQNCIFLITWRCVETLHCQMMVSIFKQLGMFKLRYVYCFLSHNAIAHLIDNRIVEFCMHCKTKIKCTHFIMIFTLLAPKLQYPQGVPVIEDLYIQHYKSLGLERPHKLASVASVFHRWQNWGQEYLRYFQSYRANQLNSWP